MSDVFKVWVHVERIDEENGDYEEVTMPESSGGEFATEEEARAYADRLTDRIRSHSRARR